MFVQNTMNKRTLGIIFLMLPLVALVLYAVSIAVFALAVPKLGLPSVFGFVGVGILLSLAAIVLPIIGVVLMVKHSQSFSQTGAVAKGWDVMKKNFGLVLGSEMIFVVYYVLYILIVAKMQNMGMVALFALISTFVEVFLGIGLIKIYLGLVRGQTVSFSTMFSGADLVLKMIGGAILYMLIVFGGYILFVVPGIIWSYKYSLFAFFIVDKGMGPIEALKESGKITNGAKWDLFSFRILMQAILFLGLLALGLGFLVALPVMLGAYVNSYLQLVNRGGK